MVRHRNALPKDYLLNWYRIDAVLGQGGFGITYLAHDQNLDEAVAIKEYLPIELAVREGDHSVQPVSEDHDGHFGWGLERFISEARTITKLRNASVVRVRAVFEANNTAYMVMDYEKGESLDTVLKTRRVLPEGEIRTILDPLLEGLEAVHQAGFIHRDIKPANIYSRADGGPVLLDFGSARQALFGETQTLTALVSPGYAPFEQYQAKGEKQGPWTDIYGLGATLYRMVCGVAPMDAIERSDGNMSGGDRFQRAVDCAGDSYSVDFLRAIDVALGFRPDERPQSVEAWRLAFDDPHSFEVSIEPELLMTTQDVATVKSSKTVPAVTRLRSLLTKHWKSKLGAGLILSLLLVNPIGLLIGGGIFHFVRPSKRLWFWISFVLVLLLLVLIGLNLEQPPVGPN